MNVRVNGDLRQVRQGTTIAALVEHIGCGWRGVAVAVNEDVVARSTWATVVLREGDRVEVLTASQGG